MISKHTVYRIVYYFGAGILIIGILQGGFTQAPVFMALAFLMVIPYAHYQFKKGYEGDTESATPNSEEA